MRRCAVSPHRYHLSRLSGVRCPVYPWCPVSGVRLSGTTCPACPVSGVRYRLSGVRCPIPPVRCPVSACPVPPVPPVRCPVSGVRCPVSGVRFTHGGRCPVSACPVPPVPPVRCPVSGVRFTHGGRWWNAGKVNVDRMTRRPRPRQREEVRPALNVVSEDVTFPSTRMKQYGLD